MEEVRVGHEGEHLAFVRDGADMVVRLREEGVEAAVRVWLDYADEMQTLVRFFESLSEDWRGWDGERRWSSLEGELRLAARHNKVGSVGLRVEIEHRPGGATYWKTTGNFVIDAGEQMSNWARDLAAWAAA